MPFTGDVELKSKLYKHSLKILAINFNQGRSYALLFVKQNYKNGKIVYKLYTEEFCRKLGSC